MNKMRRSIQNNKTTDKKGEGILRYAVNSAMCFVIATLISLNLVGILRDEYVGAVAVYCFIACTITSVWFYNKKTFLIGGGIIISGVTTLILLWALMCALEVPLALFVLLYIESFFKWAAQNMFVVESASNFFTPISIMLIAGCISTVMHVITVKLKWISFSAVITSAILMVSYYYVGAINYDVFDTVGIIVSLAVAVVVFPFWINYQKRSKGNSGIATALVANVLIMAMLLSPIGFFDRGDSKLNQTIYDFINDVSMKGSSQQGGSQHVEVPSFTISMSGFASSKNNDLGGSIAMDKRPAFMLYSKSPRLLRGAIYDIYTGKTWIQRNDSDFLIEDREEKTYITYDEYMEYYDKYNKVYSYSLLAKNLIRQNKVGYYKVFNQEKPTNIMLTDVGTARIGFDGQARKIYANSSIVYSKDVPKYDDVYTVMYLDLVYSKSGLSQYTFNNKMPDEYSYPAEISRYQDTSNIPESVIELADSVTTGIFAKSDIEIAWRIKHYLETQYQYSTSVVSVPENADFAEHFLFDTKKGYCTYFATAMTLLCRAAGLPARYVEGYRCDGVELSQVYNSNAHAWTEVYIYNVGWVPIDAVTADDFAQNIPQSDVVTPNNSVGAGSTLTPTIVPTPTPGITSPVPDDSPSGAIQTPNVGPSATADSTGQPHGTDADEAQAVVCILIVAICAGMILFLVLTNKSKKKKIKRLYNAMSRGDVRRLYLAIISDARRLGFKCSQDTAVDDAIGGLNSFFAEHLNITLEKEKIDNAIACVNEAVYANKRVKSEKREALMYLYDQVCGRVAVKRGIILELIIFIFRGI